MTDISVFWEEWKLVPAYAMTEAERIRNIPQFAAGLLIC